MMKEMSFQDFSNVHKQMFKKEGALLPPGPASQLASGGDSRRPLTVAVCHLEGASCISLGRAVLGPGGLFTYVALFCDLQLASPVLLG